jgi:hypothetical protein
MLQLSSRTRSVVLLSAAWALVGCSEPNSTLSVAFHGRAPTLGATEVSLELQVDGRTYRWSPGAGANVNSPEQLARLQVHGGDSITAVAIVRSPLDAELARVRLGFRAEDEWDYGIAFQVGGENPDRRGFCHSSPERAALRDFTGDTLFLWRSGLPRDAVC